MGSPVNINVDAQIQHFRDKIESEHEDPRYQGVT